MPGTGIVVNRDNHEDGYVALRDAFDGAKRQLDDYSRRLCRETRAHEAEYIGKVVRHFPEEAYGFIRRADGEALFFNSNCLSSSEARVIKAVAVIA